MKGEKKAALPDPLQLDMELVEELLLDFIRSEIQRIGLSRAVVGLSGGVDSTVVVHLCVKALGAENVLAVMMPHRTSNPDSLADARKVVEMTKCRSREVDISPMVDPYIRKVVGNDQVRRGNVFARFRMVILYDLSAAEKALVVGTSNKTEILLGYSTLHGDTAWALGPLGDLYKTQVRKLAVHLGVDQAIVEKPPSADLWDGQTDEAELGITYDEADRLLVELVDRRIRPESLVRRGENEKKIENLVKRIRRNQFKRTPPPIPKISSRTFGHDWLYARDWMT